MKRLAFILLFYVILFIGHKPAFASVGDTYSCDLIRSITYNNSYIGKPPIVSTPADWVKENQELKKKYPDTHADGPNDAKFILYWESDADGYPFVVRVRKLFVYPEGIKEIWEKKFRIWRQYHGGHIDDDKYYETSLDKGFIGRSVDPLGELSIHLNLMTGRLIVTESFSGGRVYDPAKNKCGTGIECSHYDYFSFQIYHLRCIQM